MILTNTEYFLETRKVFEKHKTYCRAPKGSYAYREFWLEENKRCIEGYKAGDLYIPGTYYFYLNFTQIPVKDKVTGRKKRGFPLFTDVDLEFFKNIELARSLKKGFVFLKPRRIGASEKNAALVNHEYNFYRDSKCLIGAFQSDLSENTMKMCLGGLNFLDKETEWKKQRNPDTMSFVQARYKETTDGVEVWKGYNSSIERLTFKDNPFASIGRTASIFLLEEAGRFPNLISSYNISEPCWKDGDDMIGIPVLYGTGGDMEGGTADFAEMFYNPDKYNLLAFDNTWDGDTNKKRCGWFVPASRMRFGDYKDPYGEHPEFKGIEMVDKEGNSNTIVGEQSVLDFRKSKLQGRDPKAVRDATTQYPLSTEEAFLISKGARFPIDLQYVLADLESNEIYKNAEWVGRLVVEDNKVVWKNDPTVKPIQSFPIAEGERKEGGIVIYEMPLDINGEVPHGIYIAGIDPYDTDQAEYSDSLGSTLVYNRLTKRIVAEYTARPELAKDYYENVRRLLMFYNATAMYENEKRGLFSYFENRHCTHLLADTPKIIKDIIKRTTVNRGKGAHANKELKNFELESWKTFLLEPHGDPDSPNDLNLHRIRSIPFIKEMMLYNDDGNFDRVDAAGMLALYMVELEKYPPNDPSIETPDTLDFFKRPLYLRNRISY